jgi:hypothetical protein
MCIFSIMHPFYEYPTKDTIEWNLQFCVKAASTTVRRLLVLLSLMCLGADALERDSPVLEFDTHFYFIFPCLVYLQFPSCCLRT